MGGRTEKSGPYLRLRDGKWVALDLPGRGGSHGQARPYVVKTCETEPPHHERLACGVDARV